ncbi:hypothetical protein C8J57DRAFT_1500225 [Mycena rebaudengoi]|nr:hypothetical protein C8J57DRAFT_1500225 [Mycena rebaudengoi]
MVRATRDELASKPTTRRSTRLNKQEIKNNAVVEIQRPKRRRKASDTSSSLLETTSMCTLDSLDKSYASSDLRRRSSRITPAELARRESALEMRESECKRRANELAERSMCLSKREDEAAAMLSQIAARESKATLAQLEEHFTCALCYEIMAQPYSLNPGQCGHTFCAMCILKHFFSRLHRICSSWHEPVDCPMCRAFLVITPDRVPRPEITFPFVPNRKAGEICEAMIEKLKQSPSHSRLVVKREESEGAWPGSEWDMEWGRKKGKSKQEEEMEEENSAVAAWREGGSSRAEWIKRDRQGRKEMMNLVKNWTTMRSHEFLALKVKFEV